MSRPDVRTDDACELLRAILLELQGLRGDLAARSGSAEVLRVGRIVGAVWAAIGSEDFTTVRLIELAQAPHRPALAHAVEGFTKHGIGKTLAAAEGEVFDGLRLVRVNPGRKPGRWRLCDVESRQSRSGFNPFR